MVRTRSLIVSVVIGAACWLGSLAPPRAVSAALAQAAQAVGDWKSEFEEVCARTQDAMVLSTEELRALVGRCDRLKPLIDQLGESERKVYSRRLQACRNLYAFVLESRPSS